MIDETDECVFDLKMRDKKLIIRLIKEPSDFKTGDKYLQLFFSQHEAALKSIKTKKSVLCLLDIQILQYNWDNIKYIEPIASHFKKMRNLSIEKLKACCICVSGSLIATIIQPFLNLQPDEVPTHITNNIEEAKKYLKEKSREK